MGLAEEINLFFGKSIPYWGNVFQLNQCRLERTKYLDQCAYSYWGPRLSITGLPRYGGNWVFSEGEEAFSHAGGSEASSARE